MLVICLGLLILATSCSGDDRRELRLTRTATATAGVRVLADNCPGPSSVALLIRNDVLWEIQAPTEPPNAQDDPSADQAVGQQPGLVDFLIGETPEGWTATVPLTETLEPGIRYTVRTLPDRQTIDFSTPDLRPGLVWDGSGVIQFNPDLANEECNAQVDAGVFARNVVVLGAFGATAAAMVLVAVILVLFVITRRFSRIRSIQQKLRQHSEPSTR